MENVWMLEVVLDDYGVKGQIIEVCFGLVVMFYELEFVLGLKVSCVIGFFDDIVWLMLVLLVCVSIVLGCIVIGIELFNVCCEKVVLWEILVLKFFGDGMQLLFLVFGKDIGGGLVVVNLVKMLYLLIVGIIGLGKFVVINIMILLLFYKLMFEECWLIMIDFKMLELLVYDGILYLLFFVVIDLKKVVVVLKWVVGEMEECYCKMFKMGVCNIEGYNGCVCEVLDKFEMFCRIVQIGFDEDIGELIFEIEEFQFEIFFYIVVIVDEMVDLMMVVGKEIEVCIQWFVQMVWVLGIYLIMVMQWFLVDVIIGMIKVNFLMWISFQVMLKIDSCIILGEQGVEQLLGQGDMLYMVGGFKIICVYGFFVSDEEVEEIVNYLKFFGLLFYMLGVVEGFEEDRVDSIDQVLGLFLGEGGDGEFYDMVVVIVVKDRKCLISYIQCKLVIGYNKVVCLVEQMEDQGVVSFVNYVGKCEVLVFEV